MRRRLKAISIFCAVMVFCALGFAVDGSSLKPPKGARVAIVMFEDMECPSCARSFPIVHEVAKSHNVAVVFYDFPLPAHPWSFNAAVFARFFQTQSEKLGDEFRGYIFENQPQIFAGNLQQYVQKFADDNKVPLPFAVDPQGKLKEAVEADRELGNRIGVNETPTIFVVGNGGAATPAVQVKDTSTLTQVVEDMQKKVGPAPREHHASAKSR